MTRSANWLDRHYAALDHPSAEAAPLSLALQACNAAAVAYGHDGFLRDGVAQLLLGTRRLLNAPLGGLDGGTMDRMLIQLAESIGYDLDTEEFTGRVHADG